MRDRAGHVFDVQRFSLHDGPGIRTTVFLQGCPLRCTWCHNPEGLVARPILSYLQQRCTSCGQCSMACPHDVHSVYQGRHELRRAQCNACGMCLRVCPHNALELVGRRVSVGEIIDEVHKDQLFYRNSGGGITISGGEPTLQIAFLEALLQEAGTLGIHRAVETCGHAPWNDLDRVRPLVELFLFDLKETDPERHLQLTGQRNELILDNLHRLHASGAAIILRLPLVPGVNDSPEHFRAVAELARKLSGLRGIELMAFHPMGESKRQRFGLAPSHLAGRPATTRAEVGTWLARLSDLGVEASCQS